MTTPVHGLTGSGACCCRSTYASCNFRPVSRGVILLPAFIRKYPILLRMCYVAISIQIRQDLCKKVSTGYGTTAGFR